MRETNEYKQNIENILVNKLNEISDEKEKVEFLMEWFGFHCNGSYEPNEVHTIKIDVSDRICIDISEVGITVEDLLEKRLTNEQREELKSKMENLLMTQLEDYMFEFKSDFLDRFGIEVGYFQKINRD